MGGNNSSKMKSQIEALAQQNQQLQQETKNREAENAKKEELHRAQEDLQREELRTIQERYEAERQLIEEQRRARDDQFQQQILALNKNMYEQSQRMQKEARDHIEADRRAAEERTRRQISALEEQHNDALTRQQQQHNQMMDVMGEQIEHQRTQNAVLMENLQKLTERMQAFQESRDAFVSQFSGKPEKDITGPEDTQANRMRARKDLNLDTQNCYNFAFVGRTKTGKSSLINAVRGLYDDDEGAAKVDITECTNFIEPYTFPQQQLEHVRLYDIPGAGTLTHNTESYYQDKCLCAFDCLIILTQGTLGQDEINFALQALRYNQPIAFVRSHCDTTMDNLKRTRVIKRINQQTANQTVIDLAQRYQSEIMKNTPELSRVPCFFLSSHNMRDLINGEEPPEVVFQEPQFLDYIRAQSRFARNMVSN